MAAGSITGETITGTHAVYGVNLKDDTAAFSMSGGTIGFKDDSSLGFRCDLCQ
jgi:hypothetical protein